MLDPKLLRQQPELVRETLKKRQLDTKLVDDWLRQDKHYRELKLQLDQLRHQRNVLSENINKLKKEHKLDEANKKIAEAKAIAEKIKKNEEENEKLELQLKELILAFPNLVALNVPQKEKIIESHGKLKKEKWQKDYLQLSKELGLIDFDSAVRMAGEGFYVLTGNGARLQRALINFCLDVAIKNSYIEEHTPILLNEKATIASGHLPKFKEGMYKTENFYLSPTEEIGLLNLYANKTFDVKQLPINVTAYMPSFRTEKGATKGILRTHQFDEIELFKFARQEESYKELEKMVKDAAQPLKALKLPFRVKLLPASDIAVQSAITYDIDAFLPRSGWLEVSSCSNCLDFQARRARIFYMEKGKKKFVHTLNGTALGLNRVWAAIVENYQQKDGSIKIPSALHKYTGFKKIEAIKRKK